MLCVCAFCVSLGGCMPGTYVSRPEAKGVVVDAVSREPLSGVRVSYGAEDMLTDGSGGFSFAAQKSVAMFYLAGERPFRGNYLLSFSKEGYVTLVVEGDGTVALEPAAIPEGIAALDAGIARVQVMHRPDGGVAVWLTFEREGDFGGVPDLAENTRAVAEKVIRSGLAGLSPGLGFTFIRYGEDPQWGKISLWSVETGWTGETLRAMNLQRLSARQWLNGADFARVSPELAQVFASFAMERNNARTYGPFFEKIASQRPMPDEFHVLKQHGWQPR